MLKTLCMLDAASGREDAVRDFVLKNLPADATHTVDALGNILVEKKGAKRAKHKVALFAHMDEVALLITHITDDGFLRFETVGGIDARVLFGKAVRLESGAVGVIGGKAVHHLSKDERDKLPDVHALCIDIGAASREEAERYAALGDNAYFCADYTEFGDGFVKAKALDDRVGFAILLEMLQKPQPYDLTCCFTVQEEIARAARVRRRTRCAPTMRLCSNAPRRQTLRTLRGTSAYARSAKRGGRLYGSRHGL